MLNLYYLTPTVPLADWYVYESAIVAAENEDAARATHPSGDQRNWDEVNMPSWVGSMSQVVAKKIGTADAHVKPGVVHAVMVGGV